MSHVIVNPLRPMQFAVTMWNRLEGRPRTEDFDRAMRAEVRDALWMLSKQWQMGEFVGDDAGSPVLAKLHMVTTRLTKYRAGPEGGPAEDFGARVPLEAEVERQPITFTAAGHPVALDIRALMGRHWLQRVRAVDATLVPDYITAYGFDAPDPTDPLDATLTAHRQVWQQLACLAGRAMDGYALYAHLVDDPAHTAWDDIATTPSATAQTALAAEATAFVDWYGRLYFQPPDAGNPSWRPEYLEHRFAVSAPRGTGEKVLEADEYHHGHLDWYSVDVGAGSAGLGAIGGGSPPAVEDTLTRTIIPTSVAFAGMPDPRWWAFEDRATDIGFIEPDTTDLNKLLLAEFILVYANDWFVVPVTLPYGTLAAVEGLMVTNVFGEHIWVQPAGAGADQDWERWSMFTNNVRGTDDVPADTGLVVLPAALKVHEGTPHEEFMAVRDEMANMVWAVESRVPLANGRSVRGNEAGRELRDKLQSLVPPPPPSTVAPTTAQIRYQLVNSVPEEWIPFVPVHIPGQQRQVQLQRAAMPRILEGDTSVARKIEPRTSLLRHGLDALPPDPYVLHEEEVPRAGIRVSQSFQRTRWLNGEVVTWVGIRKSVGRGGDHSGLAFDQIVHVPDEST